MAELDARHLNPDVDVTAPDGAEVRLLCANEQGSMAHFTLNPGQVSMAVSHNTVGEIWYILEGSGRMWRKLDGKEEILKLKPGLSFTIPLGTHFQFRCDGDTPLKALDITMPPWPGPDEAFEVEGKWASKT